MTACLIKDDLDRELINTLEWAVDWLNEVPMTKPHCVGDQVVWRPVMRSDVIEALESIADRLAWRSWGEQDGEAGSAS